MNMKQLSEQDSAQLSALLDGTLPEAQAAVLRQRMQSDDALQDAFTELALTRDAMQALPVAQPPRSLRIDPQRLHQARGWRWWLVMPPAGQLIPNMAVALSLCLCIVFGQQALTTNHEPEMLKGAVVAESLAPDAGTDSAASAAPAADAAPDMQVVAPAPADMTSWWWAGAGVGAGAALASMTWARRVAHRRRVVQKQ